MARTPLLRSLRQLARDARASRATGVPVDELRDIRAQRAITRRRFLTGAAAGAALLAVPGRAAARTRQPTITIVGGGIAGLTCALTLRDHGFAATVYEASGRVGGRMFSNPHYFAAGQVSEWCGELIDTGHETVQNLARRFRLPLDDLHAAEPRGSTETYFFAGRYYAKPRADADFLVMFDRLQADLDAAPFPTTFDASTRAARALDHLSIRDWIASRVPGGLDAPLGQLLDTAYAIEYGADTAVQSSLNLIYLLGFQPSTSQIDERSAKTRGGDSIGSADGARGNAPRGIDERSAEMGGGDPIGSAGGARGNAPHGIDIFGESDEAFHIRGGNQRLPEAIAASLGDAVIPGHRLVRLERTAAGYRSTFERGRGSIEVSSDFVVLALPFAVLADVDTRGAGFEPRKRRAIAELGRGHNGKLNLQFEHRGWRDRGPWPGIANGSSYADTGYQASWDVTRAQPGEPGILVLYSGGSVTDAMRSTAPFALASDPRVGHDVERGLAQLGRVYPGLAWNGRAAESIPHRSPFFGASYAYYRVGQYTDFGGFEGAPQGGVYFCGEHTSQDFQGFMEGGAVTGEQTALDLIDRIR